MANVIEVTGKTINEAIQTAVTQLGVNESDLSVEVLETPTKRLFGLFGEKPAKIRVTVKADTTVTEPVTESVAESIVEPVTESVTEPISEPVTKSVAEESAENFEPILEPSPVEAEEPFDREKIVNNAKNFLQEVFATMELEVTIEVTEEAADSYIFDLKGKNLGVLIGRRGQALDALQYLANLAVNRKLGDDKIHFTLDVEDYRRRREETLTKLANSVAERAIKTRKEVRLEPMNRHERKIIHTVLQDNDRVETHSSGEDPYRYVIVTPVKRGKR